MPGRNSRPALWVLVLLCAVLLGVFVPPLVNVNRYRNRVASAIGSALGRDVTVSNIELKLLPRPGMVLSYFVVAEDPAYGPEPMLRADTVTAYLRLSSLWRGRLEIGTLSLENPSLNLVRRRDGHWNLEELVERTAQVPSAPTAKPSPESRPRFPYIEATAGRINFKLGLVKKAFAFADADFALWLQSEDEWGLRLEARPVRSDVPVSETGTLRMEGRFQRASQLRDTPVNLKLNFAKGQLGQLTALVYARDRGWRGSVTSDITLAGTPTSLAVTLDARVDDFRRYDIALGEAFRLSVHCTGTYSSPDDSIRDIQCQAPVRPGLLMVRGNVLGWNAQAYDLGISAEQVPLDRVVALARHTKKDLPEDLTATGSTDAVFTVRKDPNATPLWAGGGRTTRFALQSKVLKEDLELGVVEFSIPEENAKAQRKQPLHATQSPQHIATVPPLRVVVKPFAMPLGAPSPSVVGGYFDLAEYRIALKGDAELSRVLSIARAMGIITPAIGLAGPAQLDLGIAGAWTGFAPPAPSGKLQLRNATVELQGVLEPLQVSTATATLADRAVTINSLAAEFKDGPTVNGTAMFPLRCADDCLLWFNLHTTELSFVRLNQLLRPGSQDRPWYHLLASGQQDENALMKLQARGLVSVGRLSLGDLVASNLTAHVEVNKGSVSLQDLTANLLGGQHTGNWDADFSVKPPKFFGSGAFTKVAMAQVAALMHDPWATGTLDAQYTLGLSGLDNAALRDSATGSATFKWAGGMLRHVTLENDSAPLSFTTFAGGFALRNGSVNCQNCTLKSSGVTYNVNGSATLNRILDLRLDRPDGSSYAVSGPLDTPRVETVPAPPSEAKLR